MGRHISEGILQVVEGAMRVSLRMKLGVRYPKTQEKGYFNCCHCPELSLPYSDRSYYDNYYCKRNTEEMGII